MSADLASLPPRITAKVLTNADGCWIWQGRPASTGYGQISWYGRRTSPHVLVYELTGHVRPEGLVLDHLCRVPLCVNPTHLQAVTNKVNVLRGVGPSARNATKTHCPAGHEYTAANTWIGKANKRSCRTCHRAHQLAYTARRRAGAA